MRGLVYLKRDYAILKRFGSFQLEAQFGEFEHQLNVRGAELSAANLILALNNVDAIAPSEHHWQA